VRRTVPVGARPTAATDDALTHRLFVVNTASDAVSVLDARTGVVLRSVAVGKDPSAAGVDEARKRVFVANSGSGTVSVLDARTGTVLRSVAVGQTPTRVAVDVTDGQVFVANSGSGTISVLDATTGAVRRTIAVGRTPSAVEVDPTRHRIFVANTASGTVSVLDLTTGAVLRTVAVGTSPAAVVMDRVGGRAFVVNRDSNPVSVLDAGGGRTAAGVGNRQHRQRRLRLPERGSRHGLVSSVGHASSPTVIPSLPLVLLSPTALYFGKQGGGTTSGVQTIHAVNLGATPLTVTGIDIAGADSGDFAERDTCEGAPIAAYSGCTISIKFTPLGSGMHSATLVITDSATGSPQNVPLSGHGSSAERSAR
jgi:YVTN family beta-propeller protein